MANTSRMTQEMMEISSDEEVDTFLSGDGQRGISDGEEDSSSTDMRPLRERVTE